MKLPITSWWAASALGVGPGEMAANLKRGEAPGMRLISGDIPGREIFFGGIDAPLPEISERRWNMRSCRLLELAVRAMKGDLDSLIAHHGADRVGIVIGASNTGIDEAEGFVDEWLASGTKPDALDFSMIELGTPSAYLAQRLGVTGPAYTVSTACSSAAKAFGAARRLIERGICDAVITGGVDGRCRFAMNGFAALGALAQGRCRPLAPDRDGINLGEAVALFVIEGQGSRSKGQGQGSKVEGLRSKDQDSSSSPLAPSPSTLYPSPSNLDPKPYTLGPWPLALDPKPYTLYPRPLTLGPSPLTLSAIGESSDAYHVTAPDPDGKGAEMAMRAALADAHLEPSQVSYVNLHGTGTIANDDMELKALERVFGSEFAVCSPDSPHPQTANCFAESTKSLTGHCLGAAGAIEAAICLLRLAELGEGKAAISNSFAFGGSNASVVFQS